jgi:hypothetical protein
LHGIQIATTGKIYDVTDGNSYFFEIMQLEAKEWSDLEAWYKPKSLELEEKFKAIVNVYKEFVPENKNQVGSVNFLNDCEKQNVNIKQKFDLELAIHSVQRKDFPSLYEFHTNPPNTPCRSEVAKECCGLVLEKGNHGNSL